jgi:hypothetical protein
VDSWLTSKPFSQNPLFDLDISRSPGQGNFKNVKSIHTDTMHPKLCSSGIQPTGELRAFKKPCTGLLSEVTTQSSTIFLQFPMINIAEPFEDLLMLFCCFQVSLMGVAEENKVTSLAYTETYPRQCHVMLSHQLSVSCQIQMSST